MANEVIYDSLGYYKILGITPFSSEEDLRQKYRELAKFWHPDHNTSPDAVDMFQKLSVAYDELKDDKNRLKYTLLSSIYNQNNFPNMDAICIIRNMHWQEDLNLRAFRLKEITGKGITHSCIDKVYYCSQYEASGVVAQITKHNWMCGFWGITAIFANIGALISNFTNINNKRDNFLLCLHNSLVCDMNGKKEEALTLALLAKEYASKEVLPFLNKYIDSFGDTPKLSVKGWNFSKLKRIQLFYPFMLVIALFLIFGGIYLTKFENNRKNGTGVKEVVVFSDGKKTFSDVAVAKIFDIPVNVYDREKLFHVKEDTNAMHGADESFDVYKTIEKGTTVRITGQTIDNKWLRVMFDNGEMAFIKADKLEKGIGNEIPLWSKIYKEN